MRYSVSGDGCAMSKSKIFYNKRNGYMVILKAALDVPIYR